MRKFLLVYSKLYHSAFAKDIKNFDKPLRLKFLAVVDKIATDPSVGSRENFYDKLKTRIF